MNDTGTHTETHPHTHTDPQKRTWKVAIFKCDFAGKKAEVESAIFSNHHSREGKGGNKYKCVLP